MNLWEIWYVQCCAVARDAVAVWGIGIDMHLAIVKLQLELADELLAELED
jgi:hypothetical protein